MGERSTYRWERRRAKKSRNNQMFSFDILDYVMLSFTFILWFFALRLFLIYEFVTSPCTEMVGTLGGYKTGQSIYLSFLTITILLGLYWTCVAGVRIVNRDNSWTRLTWHFSQFIAIFFLFTYSRMQVPTYKFDPPDGWMVVDRTEQFYPDKQLDLIHKAFYTWENSEKVWWVGGHTVCVWRDREIIAAGQFDSLHHELTLRDILALGKPHIEALKERQTYRSMTPEEIRRYDNVKKCLDNIENYGKHRSFCQSENAYKIDLDLYPDWDERYYNMFIE